MAAGGRAGSEEGKGQMSHLKVPGTCVCVSVYISIICVYIYLSISLSIIYIYLYTHLHEKVWTPLLKIYLIRNS